MRPLVLAFIAGGLLLTPFANAVFAEAPAEMLQWDELPPLPNELGVAGPFIGVHQDALIVAGGANFPQPVWESQKVWHDDIHVLTKTTEGFRWRDGGKLPRNIAYGAAASTKQGVVCIGGNDATAVFDEVFLLRWNRESESIDIVDYPRLPKPCAYGAATLVGGVVYLAGGQSGQSLDTAMTNFWALDLATQDRPESFQWQELEPWPGSDRAFNLTITQHNGFSDCIYVISGRRQAGTETSDVEFLKDVWEFSTSTNTWRRRADCPVSVMAGSGIGVGQSHVMILGGADGSRFFQSDTLRDEHPGFPKRAWAYHTITDTWTSAGETPANQVTTTAVRWGEDIVVASGEIRPRVRSPKVFRVKPRQQRPDFGWINYSVLIGYLGAMVGIGVFFARKHRNTDDFFRGGQSIPWWAAGCSIFATMLSSLTYTGIPSKAFAQDWVYAIGNFTIPVVAIVAVHVAMPFFRRIDATSAYEYLEKRFSRAVRWFGSLSFILFHLFRMAVVMSLTGLVLSVATPLSPAQSVLLMGLLSIVYCAMGGIEAVIWTDTIQTFVLMGGAILALILLFTGIDGGVAGFVSSAQAADKFALANLHWDATRSQIALWVIVIGGLSQNLSSYTADQAVVQRYTTTATRKLAARSIWTNALLTIPSTLLFFGIGTALYSFYQSNPEKLDPTITTDQVFPLFIAREMPIGVAGLIVAGVFAAAQSTVSTSMNSTATALIVDFLRPAHLLKSEHAYLQAARVATITVGLAGTLIGLLFVNPSIKSLFDEFIKVIGLFMGVLGGLFVLGAVFPRANAFGAMTGASVGVGVMLCLWQFTGVNGYLYTTAGIGTCVFAGLLASLITPASTKNLQGLTIFTLNGEPLLES